MANWPWTIGNRSAFNLSPRFARAAQYPWTKMVIFLLETVHSTLETNSKLKFYQNGILFFKSMNLMIINNITGLETTIVNTE